MFMKPLFKKCLWNHNKEGVTAISEDERGSYAIGDINPSIVIENLAGNRLIVIIKKVTPSKELGSE